MEIFKFYKNLLSKCFELFFFENTYTEHMFFHPKNIAHIARESAYISPVF
jgi:hypothetical protein